jgi:hypothetical protein
MMHIETFNHLIISLEGAWTFEMVRIRIFRISSSEIPSVIAGSDANVYATDNPQASSMGLAFTGAVSFRVDSYRR